jgi:hypothetical protein
MENATKPLFLDAIKSYFRLKYIPVKVGDTFDFCMTTNEVFENIESLYPKTIEPTNVAEILLELGFLFDDFGEMQFKWLFKNNINA